MARRQVEARGARGRDRDRMASRAVDGPRADYTPGPCPKTASPPATRTPAQRLAHGRYAPGLRRSPIRFALLLATLMVELGGCARQTLVRNDMEVITASVIFPSYQLFGWLGRTPAVR